MHILTPEQYSPHSLLSPYILLCLYYTLYAYCLYSTMFCIEFSIQKSVRVCVCMHVCLMLCIHVCVSTCGVCVPWRIIFYSRPCIIIATCTCILLLQPLFWMYMPFSLLSHLQPHNSKKKQIPTCIFSLLRFPWVHTAQPLLPADQQSGLYSVHPVPQAGRRRQDRRLLCDRGEPAQVGPLNK